MIFDPAIINELYYSSSDAQVFHLQRHGTCWESQNIGLGSAGGVYAIILANIVAIFLMRIVGKNLDA